VNPGTLTVAQFGVLGRHFARLDLARRYAKNASTVLARLIRQFRTPASLGMGQARMRQRLEQMAEDRALVSPPNHWEVALMDTLAATDDFTEHVFN
jgi:hypothetical protein